MNTLTCADCPDRCALLNLCSAIEEGAIDARAEFTTAQLTADLAAQTNEGMQLRDLEEQVLREITGDRPKETDVERAGLRELAYESEVTARGAALEALQRAAIAGADGETAVRQNRVFAGKMERLCRTGGPFRGRTIFGLFVPTPAGPELRCGCSAELRYLARIGFQQTADAFPQTAGLVYEELSAQRPQEKSS